MESGGLRVESELEMSLDFCEQQEGHPPRSRRSSDRHPALDAGTKATSIAVHQFPAQGRDDHAEGWRITR